MQHLTTTDLLVIATALLTYLAVQYHTRLGQLREEVDALKFYAKNAAPRAFDAAKPALIHAADQIIDALPGDVPVAALESKAAEALTTGLAHLLALNPLLAGGVGILTATVLPLLKLLPADVDVSAYKTRLKSVIAKAIQEARL